RPTTPRDVPHLRAGRCLPIRPGAGGPPGRGIRDRVRPARVDATGRAGDLLVRLRAGVRVDEVAAPRAQLAAQYGAGANSRDVGDGDWGPQPSSGGGPAQGVDGVGVQPWV